MNRYSRFYKHALERNPKLTWMDTALILLCEDLEQAMGKPIDILGPFGLRNEMLLTCDNKYLMVTCDEGPQALQFYYDTGETTGEYPVGSMGDINGFNNVRKKIPDDPRKTVKLFI